MIRLPLLKVAVKFVNSVRQLYLNFLAHLLTDQKSIAFLGKSRRFNNIYIKAFHLVIFDIFVLSTHFKNLN